MGTVVEVPFAAHGYGSYFALSLLDRYVAAPYCDYLSRSTSSVFLAISAMVC
jgi:20S proteasome alpha/beta subunit